MNKKTFKHNKNENEVKSVDSQIMLVKKKNKMGTKNFGSKEKKENNNFFVINIYPKNEDKKNSKKNEEKKEKKINIAKSKSEIQSIEIIKNKKLGKINIKYFNEVDFNEFDYNEALEYDKRTFKILYFSYVRLKHPIFCLFYDNYNITAIKYILFIYSFGTHICMNGLFFREDTMHRVYIDYGKFGFIYRLPLTIYSIAISGVISFGLKKLVLTQSCIIEYKKSVEHFKNKDEAIKKEADIIKCYRVKFIIFFVSILLILFVFWFYIGCFCTVYHNTQFYLFKDSLIGFGLSMIYPIILLLIAGLLRIVSIKKKYVFLYKVSKMLA